MKRLVSLALAAAMALTLTACGGGEQSAGSSQAPEFQVQDAMDAMLEKIGSDDLMELGESDMLDFFGIQAEDMEQFAAVTSAAGITAKEIILVKAAGEDAAQSVQEQLDKRLTNRMAEFKDYLPDQYDIVSQSQVRRDGVYVALIISDQQEELGEIYQGFLDGK